MTASDDTRTHRLHAERVVVDGAVRRDVVVTVVDGVVTALDGPGAPGPAAGGPSPERVTGVVVPGLVNAHSHAFHRLLRARTQHGPRATGGSPNGPTEAAGSGGGSGGSSGGGSFWTWREQMYAAAAVLGPDDLRQVARAVYGEMALAGISCVGEFHYLHHRVDGTPHDDPNVMGRAIVAAADDAGIRLTLLDACYLTGDLGATTDAPDLAPVQRRFSDGDVHRWARRVADLDESPTCRVGTAVHSVRAVPPVDLAMVAAVPARVVHAHVAEQPAEVDRARSVHGRSPVQLLADAGLLTDRFTGVHAVWVDDHDVALLGTAGATVCACPTTERDLADGVVAGADLASAGVRLALGSDQHAVVDLFEEARALELDQRLATGVRGHHAPTDLLAAATTGGATSLGWPELGRIEVGAPADLVVVRTDTVRLAGVDDDDLVAGLVMAATAEDVVATMVGGRWVVRDGQHVDLDVVAELRRASDLVGALAGSRS